MSSASLAGQLINGTEVKQLQHLLPSSPFTVILTFLLMLVLLWSGNMMLIFSWYSPSASSSSSFKVREKLSRLKISMSFSSKLGIIVLLLKVTRVLCWGLILDQVPWNITCFKSKWVFTGIWRWSPFRPCRTIGIDMSSVSAPAKQKQSK